MDVYLSDNFYYIGFDMSKPGFIDQVLLPVVPHYIEAWGMKWTCPLISDDVTLGCVIPPFLSQIISASISFGDLSFQDTQNIILFPEFFFPKVPSRPP